MDVNEYGIMESLGRSSQVLEEISENFCSLAKKIRSVQEVKIASSFNGTFRIDSHAERFSWLE